MANLLPGLSGKFFRYQTRNYAQLICLIAQTAGLYLRHKQSDCRQFTLFDISKRISLWGGLTLCMLFVVACTCTCTTRGCAPQNCVLHSLQSVALHWLCTAKLCIPSFADHKSLTFPADCPCAVPNEVWLCKESFCLKVFEEFPAYSLVLLRLAILMDKCPTQAWPNKVWRQ